MQELYVTYAGLCELQEMDWLRAQEIRAQNYSEAPLSDLLELRLISLRMQARKIKIARLEAIAHELPF